MNLSIMSIPVQSIRGSQTQSVSDLVFLDIKTDTRATLPQKNSLTPECIGILVNNESPIEGGRNGQQPKQSVVCINGVANVNAPRELGANIGLGKYIDYFGVEDTKGPFTKDKIASKPKFLTTKRFGKEFCLSGNNSRTRWRSLGISKKVSSKVSVGLCSKCETRDSQSRYKLLEP